jgi:hypothetical protein
MPQKPHLIVRAIAQAGALERASGRPMNSQNYRRRVRAAKNAGFCRRQSLRLQLVRQQADPLPQMDPPSWAVCCP